MLKMLKDYVRASLAVVIVVVEGAAETLCNLPSSVIQIKDE